MLTIRASFFKTLFFFFSRLIFGHPKSLQRSFSNVYSNNSQNKYQKYSSLAHQRNDVSNKTVIFNVEGTLLKSPSLFPYFMLVAFEAGSILRALVLFLLYPFVCFVGEEMGMKVMVMVCFFGIKKDNFKVGRAVLPKFFLEDVGLEVFEVLRRCKRKVGVSDLPQVMVESFLIDYLEFDCVVGREMKVVGGYFMGIMEEKPKHINGTVLQEMVGEDDDDDDVGINTNIDAIGICSFNRSLHQDLFSICKEIYLVRGADKRSWQNLPREKYPKQLIFHDGRLALRPIPLATLALLMWVPFGVVLALIRVLISITLPYSLSIPLLAFSGVQARVSNGPNNNSSQGPKRKAGLLYVCNHRTLLDPLLLSFALKKNLPAVTYSLSRLSEILSPIRTVRLTRDRDQDSKRMGKLLSHGDLVVCPEGTTCREPYLLRFSPLFAEMGADMVPVALDSQVTMFHGTTAGGLKCFDPFFFLMNPRPIYMIQFLDGVSGPSTCRQDGERSKFDVANHVQGVIGEALNFECTKLTRRDKYLILAGNEGISCPTGDNNNRKIAG